MRFKGTVRIIKKSVYTRKNELEERRDMIHEEKARRGNSGGIKLHGWTNSNNYINNKWRREATCGGERVVIVLARR